ncbi:MAG TPA: quinoprotein relay system zinc metallohydrolase 1 [Hyphomicrobium sp.]|nr:quinoprotein relay system zinc metallohydrolase 1 [Hyphomicrobium sp.]
MTDIDRRRFLGAAAAAAGVPFLPMFSAQSAPLTYELKPIAITQGMWMLTGAPQPITFENGGAIANITILDSSDGAIIVDTGPSRRFGEELAALARSLTGKDIARVYITHFHPDHAFGNQAFAAGSIAAPQGVIDGLRDAGASFSDAMYYIARDWMRGTDIVLPGKAVTNGVEEIGGRRLHLFALAGHTSSDLAIVDETSGTLIAGDLAFLDRAPTTPHANLATWQQSLAALADLDFKTLVPGHGPAEADKRALNQTHDWLAAISGIIQRSYERGLDILEAAHQPLPAGLEKIALARYEFERSVMHLYPKLEAERLPEVGGRKE